MLLMSMEATGKERAFTCSIQMSGRKLWLPEFEEPCQPRSCVNTDARPWGRDFSCFQMQKQDP